MAMMDPIEFRFWVSNEAHYYVKTLMDEVPNPGWTEAFDEFKDAEKNFKQWWYDFLTEICQQDRDTIDEIMDYNMFIPDKLEALGDWLGHADIKEAVYQFYLRN